jgi:hypothetical protein
MILFKPNHQPADVKHELPSLSLVLSTHPMHPRCHGSISLVGNSSYSMAIRVYARIPNRRELAVIAHN